LQISNEGDGFIYYEATGTIRSKLKQTTILMSLPVMFDAQKSSFVRHSFSTILLAAMSSEFCCNGGGRYQEGEWYCKY
jgi:hypothetical protein